MTTKGTEPTEITDLSADAIRTATNLPATTSTATPAVPVEDEWAAMRAEFADGSQAFKEHFGLSIPRFRTDFGRNGQGFVDDLSGETFKALEVVLLAYPPSRAWWAVSIDDGGGGAPDCRSHDMIVPDPSSPLRQSDRCASCPHSKWGDNNERPSCAESVNVVAYDVGGDRFVWLRFGGTALKPFKDYISYLESRRLVSFAVTTNVTLEERSRDALRWLVPKMGMGRNLTPDEVRPMREIAKAAMDAWREVAEEMDAADPGPFDDTVAAEGEIVEEEMF
jgi:hypothetical protein